MFSEISLMAWMGSAIIFVIGGGVGFFTARQIKDKHTLQLEEDLQTAQNSLKDYQGDVNRHFLKTSLLFNKLTDNYREVYEHLATGAQKLCNEKPDTTALNLPEAKILSAAITASAAATEKTEPTDSLSSADIAETEQSATTPLHTETVEPSETALNTVAESTVAESTAAKSTETESSPMESKPQEQNASEGTSPETPLEDEQKMTAQMEETPTTEITQNTPTISAEELNALEASEQAKEDAEEVHLGAESAPGAELDHHKTHPAIH